MFSCLFLSGWFSDLVLSFSLHALAPAVSHSVNQTHLFRVPVIASLCPFPPVHSDPPVILQRSHSNLWGNRGKSENIQYLIYMLFKINQIFIYSFDRTELFKIIKTFDFSWWSQNNRLNHLFGSKVTNKTQTLQWRHKASLWQPVAAQLDYVELAVTRKWQMYCMVGQAVGEINKNAE